ncbi:hypothetical protein PV326_008406, partial [Microctonus aethiopoides]
DENRQENNEITNPDETTEDEQNLSSPSSSSSSSSINYPIDKNGDNNIHEENKIDLDTSEDNIINTTNKKKSDESLKIPEPMKKKHKKSLDNSSGGEGIDDNTEPSCSTRSSGALIKFLKDFHNLKDSDDDEDGDDVDNDKGIILEKSRESEINSVDQSIPTPDPETEIVRNSSIDNEQSEHSDRDEDDELDEEQSNASENADDSSEWTTASDDEIDGVPAVLKKKKPIPKWFILPELLNRQIGNNKNLDRNFYGSLHAVQRMKLFHKMDAHEGCVNALCFNESGRYIASASDDLKVIVWDWARNKYKNIYPTGHRLNIFDVKWLPIDFESLMVTCARDGQVRLIDTRIATNRRLTSHRKEARSLAVHPDHVYGILSAGDDGKVLSIDIRAEKPTRLITVKERSSVIPLYTIHINPSNSNEFCVGGRSHSLKVYDRRRILEPIHDFCPIKLRQNSTAYVTSAVYNYNGTELLVSHSDDDIYLFDTAVPHPNGDYAHHYEGHRNSITIKGVNFFGPKSEFIVSGSDCANIFIWEKNSEAIVQWMFGDNHGVVNRLESHPHVPILATSGLDSDIKLWVPSNEAEPTMPNLETCVKTNMSNRVADGLQPDVFDSRMLSVFFHHVRQYGLYPGQAGMRDRILHNHPFDDISESSNESASSNNNNGDDSSADDDSEVPQCSPS